MNRREFFEKSCIAGVGSLLPGLPVEAGNEPRRSVAASNVPSGEYDELFVAMNGSDRNPGTQQEPFATVARAKEAVRELRKQSRKAIVVWVRNGTYYLSEPLVFEAADSGTEKPITYAAYTGEQVTLSGGRKLTCHWNPYKDGIMRCELPEVRAGRCDFTQLFINGKRQIRARYPNYDHQNPLVGGTGYIDVAKEAKNWPAKGFPYDAGTFTKKRWAKPQEAVVHIFHNGYFGSLQWNVESVDWETHVVNLGWGGFQINIPYRENTSSLLGPESRYFIENVFEELDAPGEWYLDKEEGLLYYMPAEGIDLADAVVEVPILDSVIEFRGSQRNPVRQITLSGFRIAHTASTFLAPYEAPARGDWTLHRGGAVFLEGAEDCGVEKCFFDAVGGNGVFINDYSRRIRVYGNRFTGAGDSAVCLVGTASLVQGTQWPFPAENTISNNLIHDCGAFGKQVAGVFISISEKNTVNHNLIYNMPRAGICINDGWGGGHIIEFNKIYDTVLETKDHGPFNSWGRGEYWCAQQSHGSVSHGAGNVREISFAEPNVTKWPILIRHNYFQDNHEWGIDLDDGSSNTHVYNNLCVGISIKLREGDYRLVENNTFVHPANPPGLQVGYEYNHDRFVRNIIVTSTKFDRPARDVNFQKGKAKGDVYQVIFPPLKGPILQEIDYNVFFNDVGEFYATVTPRGSKRGIRYTLDRWRKLGFDQHSVYADPMFVDPDKGDYHVKPESPAIKLGFKNFDVDKVGLLPDFPEQWRV